MTSNLTWAQQWVLRQLRFDRADVDRALDLPETPDEWTQVLDASRRYGLTGLLANRLPASAIPKEIGKRLDRARRGIQHASLVKWLALEEWQDRLQGAGISIIVLKGAALTRLVYDRLDVRPMTDIDFLVEREHFETAARQLAEAGLSRTADVEGNNSPLRTQVMFRTRQPFSTYIELHWHLIDSSLYASRVPMDWFWGHTILVDGEKPAIRILSPEAQLLHLAAHLELHHAGTSLLSLYDVAALLRKFGNSLNWELIVEQATRFQWERSLRTAVQEAQSVFGSPVSESVNARLDQFSGTYRERLARTLASVEAHPAAFILDGWQQGSWHRRLGYWKHSLFPSREFMRERKPSGGSTSMGDYARRLVRGLVRIPCALAAGIVIFWQLGWQTQRESLSTNSERFACAGRAIRSTKIKSA